MGTNVITFAGSVVSISAGVPATYDQTGFEALTFTGLGEVISVGSRGRTYNDVTYTSFAERGTIHRKGAFDEPEMPIEIGADRTDAGQLIMSTASKSDSLYAIKIEYNNGEVDYFQCLVFSFVTNGGDSDAMRTLTANVRVDRQGVLEIAAP